MNRATAGIAFGLCFSACALLASCAAPGEPTARHPVVPVSITDLAAHQSGNTVNLTFSLPKQSTDHEPLAESPAIEIYRASLPPGATPDRKTPWRQVYTIPSERVDSYVNGDRIQFQDPLPPEGPSRAATSSMAYMIRTRAARTRASGDSNLVMAHILPAPEAPRNLRTSVTETGIQLSWDSVPPLADVAPVTYRVFRAEIEAGTQQAPQGLSEAKLKSAVEVIGNSSSLDFLDSHFEFGRTYLYTVRAVAVFGAESVESEDSTSAVVAPLDTFPPAAPLGLEAAVMPATSQSPAYVELSWGISPEADLAGYYVYRSDREDTTGERINREILPSPTFRDISVMAGGRYFYRVSAVDHAGNESSKSSAVQAEVP